MSFNRNNTLPRRWDDDWLADNLQYPSRGQIKLVLSFLAVLACMASGLAQGEAIRGRKESRAQVAYEEIVKDAAASLQKAQEKKGRTAAEIGGGLHQIMMAVNSLSTAIDESVMPPPSMTPYDEFKASLPKISLNEAADGAASLVEAANTTKVTYFVVEQDILLNDLELRLYHTQASALRDRTATLQASLFSSSFTSADARPGSNLGALRGMTEAGRLVRWTPGSMLTYCVLKWTFNNNEEQYNSVRAQMAAAGAAWSAACNIEFKHLEEFDTVPRGTTFPLDAHNRRQVLFVVAHYARMEAVALSFFPNDSIDKRLLLINPTQFYGRDFSQVGVLRHELGHILGFRHEHISPDAPVWESAFCTEESSNNSAPIGGRYDRFSVMHYPCATRNNQAPAANWAMEITEGDRAGAQLVYGAPRTTAPRRDPRRFIDFDPTP